jgi:hypothetical protein
MVLQFGAICRCCLYTCLRGKFLGDYKENSSLKFTISLSLKRQIIEFGWNIVRVATLLDFYVMLYLIVFFYFWYKLNSWSFVLTVFTIYYENIYPESIFRLHCFTPGWSNGPQARVRNQKSQVQIPAVSRYLWWTMLHLLTSHGCLYILLST